MSNSPEWEAHESRMRQVKDSLTVALLIGLAVGVIVAMIIFVPIHWPSGPTNISENGKVVAILENYEGSRLVGKITESYNATELVVQYQWNYTKQGTTGYSSTTLQEPFYVEGLYNLYVGMTISVTVSPSTGSLVTVGGY